MACDVIPGLPVVDNDAGACRMVDHAVKEYDGYLLIQQVFEVVQVFRVISQGHQQAVDAAVEHGGYPGDLLLVRLLRLADDQVVTRGVGDLFNSGDYG